MLRERMNEVDGNACTSWRELGRPMSPTARELEVLRRCARLAVEHQRRDTLAGLVDVSLVLLRRTVTFVELTPVRATNHEGVDDRRLLGGVDSRLVTRHEF